GYALFFVIFQICSFIGSLTSIKIPNSVTRIEDYAFCHCSSLTNIEIPNSVTSIGDDAFSGCSSLTNIEIPNSVTRIWGSVFSGCSSLTNIEIPNSVTSIGQYAFSGCSSLTNIEIPDSVTSIGWYAFINCLALKDVYYSGTESQWNNINIDPYYGEEVFESGVTIHYNSTGPGTSTDPGIGDINKLTQIRIVENYDAVNKKIFLKRTSDFNIYDKTEFLITDETDISIIVGGVIGSLDSLAGKPVWVKFDNKTDTLLELKAVEPKFGDVSAYTTGSKQVTIGGISYTLSPEMLGTIKVGPVCFWSADKEIVSVSSPVKKEGILQWWKPSTKEVKIGENIYQAGSLTDMSFVVSIDTLLNTRVNYWLKPDDAAWPDSEILRISSIDDANYEYKQFKNYDPAKKTVYYLDGSSHTVADGITLDVNGLENQWVRCKLERASGGYTFYLTEIKKLEAELRVNFNMDKKEMEYWDGKLRFAGETGYVNKTDFEIPFSIRVSYHLSGPDSALLEQIAKDESFKTTLKKIKIEEPSGFHLGWNVKFDKPVILRPGDKELEYKGFFKAGMFFNQKEEIQQYTVLGTAESDKGKTEFIENFQITNVLAEYGTDEEPSEWDIRFLKQLNEARDINVTAKTAILNQHFDEKTLNDIGRQVDFWVGILTSELMKQTSGKPPACLELLCKMKNSDRGRLVFCYTNYAQGSTGTLSSVSFALMNDRSKNVLIANSVYEVITIASPKEFSAKMKDYLKKEYGKSWVDFCKKLMKKEIKDTISTIAKVSGKEYVESMMKLFNDYEAILKNAKKFKKHVEDASSILKNPMEWAVKPASYFGEFKTKHVMAKCPVDVYIYDGNKKLCGAIENNRITTDTSDVFLEVEGDQKGVWLGNDDYSIELVSTGSGTMHYIVEEYTGYNMKRDVDFRNVPLSKGITYQGNIPEPTNIPAAEYALISNTGEKIYANSDVTYDPTKSSGSSEDTRYVPYNKGSSGGSSSSGGSGGSSSSKGQKPLLNGSLNSLIGKKIDSKGIISKDTFPNGIISSGKVYKGTSSDGISSNSIPSNNYSNSLQGNSVSTQTTVQQTDLTRIKNANYISLAKLQKLASEAQKAQK
ncbi:leucine-rich repeat domain-containing protein, partial [bacterium 1XD42-8]